VLPQLLEQMNQPEARREEGDAQSNEYDVRHVPLLLFAQAAGGQQPDQAGDTPDSQRQ